MKNKEFVKEYLNQLENTRLLVVLQGLLDNTNPVDIEEGVDLPVETPTVVNEPIIESIAVIPATPELPKAAFGEDETFEEWIVRKAKKHLEPPAPLKEVEIVNDLYEKFYGENRLTPMERLILSLQTETDSEKAKALLNELAVLISEEAQAKKEAKQDLSRKQYREFARSVKRDIVLKKETLDAATQLGLIVPDSRIEIVPNPDMRKDRDLAAQINDKITSKEYFTNYSSGIKEIIQPIEDKNRKLEEQWKQDELIEDLERELAEPPTENSLLEKALDPNYVVDPVFKKASNR